MVRRKSGLSSGKRRVSKRPAMRPTSTSRLGCAPRAALCPCACWNTSIKTARFSRALPRKRQTAHAWNLRRWCRLRICWLMPQRRRRLAAASARVSSRLNRRTLLRTLRPQTRRSNWRRRPSASGNVARNWRSISRRGRVIFPVSSLSIWSGRLPLWRMRTATRKPIPMSASTI